MERLANVEPLTREEKLAEIANSPVSGEWFTDQGESSLSVKLPHGCHYGGIVDIKKLKFRPNELRSYRLYVPPELRGQGIGERLVRSLVASAKAEHNAGSFILNVESQYMVGILDRVFGEAIDYIDITAHGKKLPMTNREAFLSLEHAETLEKDREERTIGFLACIDLKNVDTEGWELPAP